MRSSSIAGFPLGAVGPKKVQFRTPGLGSAPRWTSVPTGGMTAPPSAMPQNSVRPSNDSWDLLHALLHLVERSNAQHAAVDAPLRRACRRGRVRQPLLPHQGRRDRSLARVRAALGHLQRLRRGIDDRTGLARLAASYGRRAADAGEGDAAAVVEAAPPQSHRPPDRAPADRPAARARPP